MNNKHSYTIIGAGGFAKETYNCLIQRLQFDNIKDYSIDFVIDDQYCDDIDVFGKKKNAFSNYDFSNKKILIGIADNSVRKQISEKLQDFEFATLIHPSVSIGLNVSIDEGAIICQNVILTCDIKIGKHAQLNLNTTVGHDSTIGDFFTSAPAVNISGNCNIGNNVYLATKVALREKITICDDVIVGMGGIVLKDIIEKGVYLGIPVKKR